MHLTAGIQRGVKACCENVVAAYNVDRIKLRPREAVLFSQPETSEMKQAR